MKICIACKKAVPISKFKKFTSGRTHATCSNCLKLQKTKLKKVCKTCGENKLLSEFHIGMKQKDGRNNTCIACYRARYSKKGQQSTHNTHFDNALVQAFLGVKSLHDRMGGYLWIWRLIRLRLKQVFQKPMLEDASSSTQLKALAKLKSKPAQYRAVSSIKNQSFSTLSKSRRC